MNNLSKKEEKDINKKITLNKGQEKPKLAISILGAIVMFIGGWSMALMSFPLGLFIFLPLFFIGLWMYQYGTFFEFFKEAKKHLKGILKN